MPSTPKTRGRKGSAETIDIAEMLRETEERLKAYIKHEILSFATRLDERLESLERNLTAVQIEYTRIESEHVKMKDIIIQQQLQIEEHENKLRENNIILQNVPENNIIAEGRELADDPNKFEFICDSVDVSLDAADIISIKRLGKRTNARNRALRVVLRDKDNKF